MARSRNTRNRLKWIGEFRLLVTRDEVLGRELMVDSDCWVAELVDAEVAVDVVEVLDVFCIDMKFTIFC